MKTNKNSTKNTMQPVPEGTGCSARSAGTRPVFDRHTASGGCDAIVSRVNPKILDLEPYPPGKPLDALKREYGIHEAVKLASNENPFGPSPMAVRAIEEALQGINRYPDGSSYYLKEALSRHWGISPECIVLGNGSNEVIQFLIHAFSGPGTEVISSDPAFLMYRKMVQIFGGQNVLVPLRGYCHDLEAILAATTQRTRLIFLDNPHNPTGTAIHRDEFHEFLQRLPEHVLICLDEAYGEFVRHHWVAQGASYIGKDPRVVFLRTFSKVYGLSGLRVGYGVMDQRIASVLERVRQPFNVNSLAQVGALNALMDKDHLEKTLHETWMGLEWYYGRFEEMGFSYCRSNTNFVLVDTGRDAGAVYQAMLKKGVIIRGMNAYGYHTSIRITMGTREENARCMTALKDVIGDMRG